MAGVKEKVGFVFPLESNAQQQKTVKNGGVPLQAANPRAIARRESLQHRHQL